MDSRFARRGDKGTAGLLDKWGNHYHKWGNHYLGGDNYQPDSLRKYKIKEFFLKIFYSNKINNIYLFLKFKIKIKDFFLKKYKNCVIKINK